MSQADREFVKKYHRAVVRSVRGDLEKVKSRMGSDWAEDFRRKVGSGLKDQDFPREFQGFLQDDLRFCERAEVEEIGGQVRVKVKGCHICHGNEELRREGSPTMCPIIPTGLFSISRVSGRKAALKEVNKTGTVGDCEIVYRLEG